MAFNQGKISHLIAILELNEKMVWMLLLHGGKGVFKTPFEEHEIKTILYMPLPSILMLRCNFHDLVRHRSLPDAVTHKILLQKWSGEGKFLRYLEKWHGIQSERFLKKLIANWILES